MNISNKVLVVFHLEDGCKQEEDEVGISWNPINFQIYNKLFIDLIDEACGEWLSENKLNTDFIYEVIFKHVVDRDGGGAVTCEYFEPIHVEHQGL